MRVTLARLRVLARQAGTPAAPMHGWAPSDAAHVAPADTGTLRQLLRLRTPNMQPAASWDASLPLPGKRIGPGLRLVQTQLPAARLLPSLSGRFDRRDDFAPDRVLFFDTETTGLAGGTGTRAFMLGCARWTGEALAVRQLLLTRVGGEPAMLREFARWLCRDTLLVSYNGKCYDAPLLRTRYRLAQLPDPLAGLEHIDLLHATRRRYRGVFENCRLATIERQVLNIVRDDDLPGSEAPAAWLAYLRRGATANLNRVLAHNQQDVATLARLLVHLATGAQADAVADGPRIAAPCSGRNPSAGKCGQAPRVQHA